MRKCSICIIWGVWENVAAARIQRFAEPTEVSGVKLDDRRLHKATKVLAAPENIRDKGHPPKSVLPAVYVPLRPSERNPVQFHDFGVQLEHGEFGEAYHVFVCRVLLGASPQINVSVTVNSGNSNTSAIEDLFHWYQIPLVENGGTFVGRDSKAEATRVIAAAFRAADAADIHKGQHALFEHIRDGLGALVPTKESLKSLGMPTRYFQPSYAAKYWLNRYFRLTKQFGKKDGRDSGMVKSSDVGRLAVVHVRRSAKSLVGRIMDSANLEYVAESIAAANAACDKPYQRADPEAHESSKRPYDRYHTIPFTHIILYGDFNYHEGAAFKELVKAKFPEPEVTEDKPEVTEDEPEHETMHVSFISSPWNPDTEGLTGMGLEVAQLWGHFRDFNVDRLPTQVKTLGIWTALRERYDDRMCVIGHRSGFVESAGLLGIPVFYLNNERGKLGAGHLKEGELLWDASTVLNPENDRLRELADVMNTFIPVEALGIDGSNAPKSNAPKSNTPKSNTPEKRQSEPPLRVMKGFEKELAAALFAYMCCLLDYRTPAWTARVRMMHDTVGGEHGVGQEWLKERCLHVLK